ncbi:MAG TPA: hypothetical protein VKB67_01980 [Rhizomicrobium sp.]|nr:hypothetical protein [Rhizomicrobium sp.]
MNGLRRDSLLPLAEKEIRRVLADKNIDVSQRLKALEVCAKLLGIRHKITDGERADGAFFEKG